MFKFSDDDLTLISQTVANCGVLFSLSRPGRSFVYSQTLNTPQDIITACDQYKS